VENFSNPSQFSALGWLGAYVKSIFRDYRKIKLGRQKFHVKIDNGSWTTYNNVSARLPDSKPVAPRAFSECGPKAAIMLCINFSRDDI